jgi:hypothetical protein
MLIAGELLVGNGLVEAKEQHILQRDKYGNVRHDEPSWAVQENGRVVAVDRFGNKRHDQPGYQIEGTKVYERDRFGNVRYDRPSQVIRKER